MKVRVESDEFTCDVFLSRDSRGKPRFRKPAVLAGTECRTTGLIFTEISNQNFHPIPMGGFRWNSWSSTAEKVTRLTTLFSRLVLPDGRGFPEGSVQCSIDEDPR